MAIKEIINFRSGRDWFSTLPVFMLLLAVIIAGNGELIHARLLNIGEFLWQDYFSLRADIPTPDCKIISDVEVELRKLEAESSGINELEDWVDSINN